MVFLCSLVHAPLKAWEILDPAVNDISVINRRIWQIAMITTNINSIYFPPYVYIWQYSKGK